MANCSLQAFVFFPSSPTTSPKPIVWKSPIKPGPINPLVLFLLFESYHVWLPLSPVPFSVKIHIFVNRKCSFNPISCCLSTKSGWDKVCKHSVCCRSPVRPLALPHISLPIFSTLSTPSKLKFRWIPLITREFLAFVFSPFLSLFQWQLVFFKDRLIASNQKYS